MAIQTNFPAIKPSLLLDFANTKQLDPRITYTRASTATFYNGVTTAKAEENLMLRSQEFDTGSWSKAGGSITANSVAAPDGTTTADTFTEDTSASSHNVNQTFSGTTALPYTWSAYVKANGRTKVVFFCQATGVIYSVRFDLTGVTTTDVSGSGTATITSVGNSWYRITATATSTATGTGYWQLNLADASNNTTYTGDGTSGVYLWGAQLEQRSAVSAYTATTTQAITNYIPALQTAASGVARFDNNPTTGESLGLLIEESRTNLQTYSSQFDNAAWTKSALTITADTVVAPDGTLTADGFIESTASAIRFAYQGLTLTAASYTLSVYARRSTGSQRWLSLFPQGTGVSASAVYDVNSGSVTLTSGAQYISSSITAVGNNWYRCTLTFTGAAVSVLPVIYISNASNAAAPSYTGDGFSGLYLWGMQLELGAFATSYIPTVASQVTRAADAASMTGTNFSSWYNQAEGTLYGEQVLGNIVQTNQPVVSVSNSTVSGAYTAVGQAVGGGSTTGSALFVVNNSSTQAYLASSSGIASVGSSLKSAAAYKVNDFAFTANAGSVGTDSLGFVPLVDRLQVGALQGIGQFNGTIKKIAYYPLRVTNAQLQALTS